MTRGIGKKYDFASFVTKKRRGKHSSVFTQYGIVRLIGSTSISPLYVQLL